MKPVSGIILAGGKSARMGIDKADLVLSGRTFLEIQTEKMKTVGVTDIMVSGWWRPLPDVRYVEDMSAGVGPLGGLQACFAAAACEDCLVLSVDVPLIPVSVLTSLLEAHFTGSKAVTLLSGERGIEPLIGVYRADLLREVAEVLENGKRSVRALLDRTGWQTVPYWGDPALLLNCNTPEDYETLRCLAGKMG